MNLIILDRDGVINEDSDTYIKNPNEWQPITGSIDAISMLTSSGFTVVVATNQSGIARGYFSLAVLSSIHEKMISLVSAKGGAIDKIFFCPHGPEDDCQCRKPKPGLFQQIQDYYGLPLTGVPAIGDSLRDLEASKFVGCQPVLVLTGKGSLTLPKLNPQEHVPVYKNLLAAVDSIVSETPWLHYAH